MEGVGSKLNYCQEESGTEKPSPGSNISADMFRRNRRPVIVGAMVFVVGLTSFFVVWAEADAIKPSMLAIAALRVLFFPVFTVVNHAHFAETYFWELAILNYFIWALFAAWLTWLWTRARPR